MFLLSQSASFLLVKKHAYSFLLGTQAWHGTRFGESCSSLVWPRLFRRESTIHTPLQLSKADHRRRREAHMTRQSQRFKRQRSQDVLLECQLQNYSACPHIFQPPLPEYYNCEFKNVRSVEMDNLQNINPAKKIKVHTVSHTLGITLHPQ